MKRRAATAITILAVVTTHWWWPNAKANKAPPLSDSASSFAPSHSQDQTTSPSLEPSAQAQVDHSIQTPASETRAEMNDALMEPSPTNEHSFYALNTHQPNLTTVIISEEKSANNAQANRLPQVVASVQRQLQAHIDTWPISVGHPVHLTLDPTGLFDDPDGDLLSYRTTLNVPGLTIRDQGVLRISGQVKHANLQPTLTIAARDEYHGDLDNAWVSAHFTLPAINAAAIKQEHPLIGGTLYRLESSDYFQAEQLNYEVVYCEAWRFEAQQVYFAKGTSKTQCPDDSQMRLIGQYETIDNNLVITSSLSALHHQQTWQMKKRYPSMHHREVNLFFTTVTSPNHVESYTLTRSKSAMEARINVDTGRDRHQVGVFDYLIPTSEGQYVQGNASNYIYDYRRDPSAEYPWPDSDFNLQSRDIDVLCRNIQHYWDLSVVAGKGEYGDIISTTSPFRDAVFCGEAYHPDWQRTYTYYNLEYSPYDEFVEGEIYSYIMRPKPQYAGMLEEFKINMRYHHPSVSRAKSL